ncbi:MAG: GNAT family N-acetyltransferase [Clostridia bacterium]|nr:GNAT family N-acetyltransferase [Clostridia bacterium]
MFTFKQSNSIKIELSPSQRSQLSSEETLSNAFKCKLVIAFDIYNDDTIIAFALLRNCDGGYFLWDFAVDIEYQNKGYGTAILKELISMLKLQCRANWITTTYKYGNIPAKHLYEKLGFIETDVVNENGIHEVNMILNLKKT